MRRQGTLTERTEDVYVMSLQDLERSIRESSREQLVPIRIAGTIPNVTVVCDPNYMRELIAYYHWGERNASNYLEDVSRISGQVFGTERELVIVPRFLLRIVSEKRSKTGVSASVGSKRGAEYQNDVFDESLPYTDYQWLRQFGPLRVIGHCHSHPDLGQIGVNPSSIDVADHADSISDGRLVWLSQIVDPIRRMTSFYFGRNMKTPNMVFYLYPADVNRFRYGTAYRRQAPKTLPQHIHKVLRDPGLPTALPAEEPPSPPPAPPQSVERPAETVPGDNPVRGGGARKKHSKKERQKKKAAKMKLKKAIRKYGVSDEGLEELLQIVMNHSNE